MTPSLNLASLNRSLKTSASNDVEFVKDSNASTKANTNLRKIMGMAFLCCFWFWEINDGTTKPFYLSKHLFVRQNQKYIYVKSRYFRILPRKSDKQGAARKSLPDIRQAFLRGLSMTPWYLLLFIGTLCATYLGDRYLAHSREKIKIEAEILKEKERQKTLRLMLDTHKAIIKDVQNT